MKNRKIVCLCGSTKFKDAYDNANRVESGKGNIVLSVAMFGHLQGLDMNGTEKKTFDELHLDKILLADEVLVLNVNGYIGESTKIEIEFAENNNKTIRYLEPLEKEEVDGKVKIYKVQNETSDGWVIANNLNEINQAIQCFTDGELDDGEIGNSITITPKWISREEYDKAMSQEFQG